MEDNPTKSVMNVKKAEEFILTYARSLEQAIYRHLFLDDSKEAVFAELKKYQNEDGGFGNGLEPDNWNPHSTPIATNDALYFLDKIDALNMDTLESREMLSGVIRYLKSHDSFVEEKQKWQFAIESNRDYPHAIWWEIEEGKDGIDSYNPTVSLAAFMVCFDGSDPIYEGILREAFGFLEGNFVNSDCLKCYLLAYQMLMKRGIQDVVDLETAFVRMQKNLLEDICKDITKYGSEYVQGASDFLTKGNDEFVDDEIQAWIDAEMKVLHELQKPDGAMDISWKWYTSYDAEFELTRTMWRGRITLDRLLYARRFACK